MRQRLFLAWLALATLSFSLTPAAYAQESDDELARQHHELATALYARGEFGAAAVEFQEAYRLSSRAELLYNLYLSLRDAGELRAAAEALRAYLQAVPEAPNAAVLRARLATLDAQFASEDAGEPPADPPPLAAPPEPAMDAPGISPIGPVLLATGGAAIVAGVVTGALALDARSRLDAMCGADRGCPAGFEGTRDEGSALATATDVLLIAGGVIAAGGLVLTLVLRDAPASEPAVTAALGPGSVSLRGTF